MKLQQISFDNTKLALASILMLAGAINCYISYAAVVQGHGVYFWYTTYEYGFLRRALLGSFFQSIISPFHFKNDPMQVRAAIAITHVIFCMITVFLNAKIFLLASEQFKKITIPFLICLIFSTSFYLKSNANCVGYLDSFILIFLQLSLICFIKDKIYCCCALSFLAMFAHEQYFFLYLPFVLYQLVFKFKKIDFRFFLPLLSIFIIIFVKPNPEAIKLYSHTGLDQDMINTAMGQALSQRTIPLITYMLSTIGSNFHNFFVGCVYYTLPALCIILIGILQCKRLTQKILFVVISLSGASIIFIAWDMWRMLSLSTASAFVTYFIFLTDKNKFNHVSSNGYSKLYMRTVKCIAVLASLFFLLSPATRIYFNGGRVDHTNKYFKYFETMLPFQTTLYVNNVITYYNGAFRDFELTNPCNGFLTDPIPHEVKENTGFLLGTSALAPGRHKISIAIKTDTFPFKCSLYFQVFGKKHVVKKIDINTDNPENIELFFDFSVVDAASASFVISIDPVQHSYTVNSIRITKQMDK